MLFAVVVGTFLPSLHNGFVDYDDERLVTANPQVQSGLTWKGVSWAFQNPVLGIWHPLTLVSHMLDCQLYGLKPWGHHLTSVLLHAANAVLLFLIFRRMTGACWRCAALAALFALHPLRVESVAWVAERKDVLSTFFWMLALWAYARYAQKSKVQSPKSKVAYVLALVFFACGLMCKPMLVTLPFVLLLLDFWPLRRLELNAQHSTLKTLVPLVREKLPFFALAAVAVVVTFLVQQRAGAVATWLPMSARLSNAPVSYLRYMGKMFWPENLSAYYPHPRHWLAWVVMAAAGLLVAASAGAILQARRRPYVTFGWLWFSGMLVPVIGLIQVGNQSMADRYSYVPSVGLLVMLVWGAHELTVRWRYQAVGLSAAALAAVILCIGFTRRQIGYWKNEESLWLHALAVTQDNDFAHYNLGVTLALRGAFDEAIGHYEEAVRINPQAHDAHSSLAYALLKRHRLAEAIQQYEEALRLKPGDAEAHNNLGNILARVGRKEEAIQHCTAAVRLNANYPEARYNLGLLLASQGHYRDAAAQFREVIRLNPNHADARRRLDQVLADQQKSKQAPEQ